MHIRKAAVNIAKSRRCMNYLSLLRAYPQQSHHLLPSQHRNESCLPPKVLPALYRWNDVVVQIQQKRWLHHQSGGGYIAEESHISNAYRKIREKSPTTVIICERIQLVGCNLLPAMAQSIIQKAQHRFRVITHTDTVSLSVLKHQIAFVEEQERRNNYRYPTAIFAMNLSNAETIKFKHMEAFTNAIAGACSLVDRVAPIIVCGIPNSGKSSLVMALTRVRTMKVKNKKEYHLPKISSLAGRTLGTKTHVMEFGNKQKSMVAFLDSPGLRPRLEDLDPHSIRLMLATKSVEPFKNFTKYMPNNDLLRLLLQAANNYTKMDYEIGLQLERLKSNTGTSGEGIESPPLPDYASAFGLPNATDDPQVFMDAYYKTTQEKVDKEQMFLVRKWQAGDFGPWLFTPYQRNYITNENMASLKNFRLSSPIVYMNDAAQEYIKRAPDFLDDKRTVKYVENNRIEQIARKTG